LSIFAKVINIVKDLAVSIPDSDFIWLSKNKHDFFINESDVSEIMNHVKTYFTKNLTSTLNEWEIIRDEYADPDEHYNPLLDALQNYISYFKESPKDEKFIISKFEEACDEIESIILQIEEDQQTRAQYEEDRAMDFGGERFLFTRNI